MLALGRQVLFVLNCALFLKFWWLWQNRMWYFISLQISILGFLLVIVIWLMYLLSPNPGRSQFRLWESSVNAFEHSQLTIPDNSFIGEIPGPFCYLLIQQTWGNNCVVFLESKDKMWSWSWKSSLKGFDSCQLVVVLAANFFYTLFSSCWF